MFTYFLETHTECEQGSGREKRGGDTESKAGSRLWAVSTEPNTGLKLMDHKIVIQAEVGRLTDWATQVPLLKSFFFFFNFLWTNFSPGFR